MHAKGMRDVTGRTRIELPELGLIGVSKVKEQPPQEPKWGDAVDKACNKKE